jgi:hypothetical protein
MASFKNPFVRPRSGQGLLYGGPRKAQHNDKFVERLIGGTGAADSSQFNVDNIPAKFNGYTPTGNTAIEKLVNGAQKEWKAWRGDGGKEIIKEGDSRTAGRLNYYWRTGGLKTSDWGGDEDQWSAAFVSAMVKQAGIGDFKFSASHSDYIRQGVKNRKNETGSFKTYKPSEVTVAVGDIIGYPRKEGVTYDTDEYYPSHSDIVVEVGEGYVKTIGGNLGNSVSTTKVSIGADGKITDKKYHAVIKFD